MSWWHFNFNLDQSLRKFLLFPRGNFNNNFNQREVSSDLAIPDQNEMFKLHGEHSRLSKARGNQYMKIWLVPGTACPIIFWVVVLSALCEVKLDDVRIAAYSWFEIFLGPLELSVRIWSLQSLHCIQHNVRYFCAQHGDFRSIRLQRI